jgi:phage gp36-like protein
MPNILSYQCCYWFQEALFEHQVRQNVYEERQNQLRWQVKLGDGQISVQDKVKVLDQRDQATKDYKVSG